MSVQKIKEAAKLAAEAIESNMTSGMTPISPNIQARKYLEHYEIESTVPGADGKILVLQSEIVPFYFGVQELLRKAVEEFIANDTPATQALTPPAPAQGKKAA